MTRLEPRITPGTAVVFYDGDPVEHNYRATAWWTSGRTGFAKSESVPHRSHFTAPKKFGGLEGRWTREELQLAAVAGCFTTALRTLATTIDFNDLEVEAAGTIRKVNTGYTFSEIVIRPTLKISDYNQRDRATLLGVSGPRYTVEGRTPG